ncbi:MAG: tetratricopeptide repeat protein, partial [Holophagales bacterium]|nr:tetratricopeptide repeat protein [Holophagales bacterium]
QGAPAVGPRVADTTSGPAPPPAARRGNRRTLTLLVTLLVVVVASAALVWRNRGDLDPSRVQLRRTVAVLGFHNVTGQQEADWISTALVEMLATEIAGGDSLRSVPGDRVAAARRQLAPGNDGEPDAESLAQLRRLLGCDYVVSGSYVSLPTDGGEQNLRLDLRLLDAALGQPVASLAEEGRSSELFAMADRLGAGLREALGVREGIGQDPFAGLPQNPEAARMYAEALDLMRGFRPEEARDHLEKALGAEPHNPLVHSALSSAWEALGYRQKAAAEARRAFDLSSSLPQEDRLAIEGRLRQVEGDWAAAHDVYRKLWESFPDNLDYGLGLAAADTAAGSPLEALATLDQLRRLPSPLSEDPRLDLAEAEAAAAAGQIERQAEAARRAMTKAEAADAMQMLARALLGLAQAERLLGRPEETARAAERALQLFTVLAHPPGRADALTARANAYFDRGELDEAARGYRAAADVHRGTGDRGGLAASLNNLAVVRKRQGDLAGADPLYAETETIYREIDDRRGLAVAVNNRAVILVEYDRLDEAMAMFEGSQEVWEEVGGVAGKAHALNNIAEVLRFRGELDQALARHLEALRIRTEANLELDRVKSLANLGSLRLARGELEQAEQALEEAARLAERVGDRASLAQVRFDLGNLQLVRGRLQEARQSHESALEERQELRQTLRQTASRIALAQLALLEGKAAEAEELASIARFQSQSDGRPTDRALATAVLVDALLELERLAEARELAQEATPWLEASGQPAVRFTLGRALARIEGETAPASALEKLDRAAADAAGLGLARESLELLLAAAEMAAGREPAGDTRRRLEQIRQQAERRGMTLYAERAASLVQSGRAE